MTDPVFLSLVFLLNIHLVTPSFLTSAEEEQIVLSMNYFRSSVVPSAANMQPLVWNEELASAASIGAQRCVLADDPNKASHTPSFDTVGEILSAVGSTTPNYTRLIEVVLFNQGVNYNIMTSTCSTQGACIFYTQLVWATTTFVGCASLICPRIQFFPIPNAVIFSCYFGPAGNIDGMRAYESGVPCSNCLEEQDFCIDNLCSSCRDFSVNNGTRLVLYDEEGGADATYFCNDGFLPSTARYSTTCNSDNGVWTPDPAEVICMLITASITLREVDDDEMDTLTYSCSIQSNYESLRLTWNITYLNELQPLTYTYDQTSILNSMNTLAMDVSTSLTEYRSEQYIASTIVFDLSRNSMPSEVKLECRLGDEHVETAILFSPLSGLVPNSPLSIQGIVTFSGPSSYTVTFEWVPPIHGDPENSFTRTLLHYTLTSVPSIPELVPTPQIIITRYTITNLVYGVGYVFTVSTVITGLGVSDPLSITVRYATCGEPTPPDNGILNYFSYIEGGNANYTCDEDHEPIGTSISTCTSDGTFVPPLNRNTCMRIRANITLRFRTRFSTRSDIECPGDYTVIDCSIMTNYYSYLHLIWRITFPGYMPITFMYDRTDTRTVDSRPMKISSVLKMHRDENIESSIALTVLKDVIVNETKVECGIGNLEDNMTLIWIVNTSVPLRPSNVNFTHTEMATNVSVTLTWDKPPGSGPEDVVDNYNITISNYSEFVPVTIVVTSSPWTMTLDYNVRYMVNITAVNCAGSSSSVVLPVIEFITCDVPILSTNGNLISYSQIHGGIANYQCEFGFLPSALMFSICTSANIWVPAPEELNCRFSMISVSLSRLERSGPNIDCPLDIISYKCIVVSNMTLQLTWQLTFLDELIRTPIIISYSNQSLLNYVNNLPMNISATLTDQGIVHLMSIVNLTVGTSGARNRTSLECRIGNVGYSTREILLIDMSQPPSPTGFRVVNRNESNNSSFIAVTFEWEPECCNLQSTTEKFTIESSINNVSVYSSSWSVSLEYNVEYTLSITAINCIGESNPLVISSIMFVQCGLPLPPSTGSFTGLSRTTEGGVVTYTCDNDPTTEFTSTCSSDGFWQPNPEGHLCIIKEGVVSRIALISVVSVPIVGIAYIVCTITCALAHKFNFREYLWLKMKI